MTLREISAALQRGEALTAEQEGTMIAALLGHNLAKLYVATGDAGGEELQINIATGDPFDGGWRSFPSWPTQSVDAALAFVAEVFPDRKRVYFRVESNSYETWNATIATFPTKAFDVFGVATAPTPYAAIMAAAIEAFLAKGGG